VTKAGEEPAWSPDGKRIAFETSSRSGATVISTIRLDGRGRRTVGSGFHPVWSSTGVLAFTRFVSDGAVIVFAVFTARPDGSRLRRVSRGRFHDMAPDWAPDGRRLVFSRFVDRGTSPNRPDGLFTIGLFGRPLHELTSSGDRNAIWSPDGRLILYVRGAHNRPRPQLFVIRPDGSGRRSILPADVAIIDADWQAKPSAAA
jgi:TolB protein